MANILSNIEPILRLVTPTWITSEHYPLSKYAETIGPKAYIKNIIEDIRSTPLFKRAFDSEIFFLAFEGRHGIKNESMIFWRDKKYTEFPQDDLQYYQQQLENQNV